MVHQRLQWPALDAKFITSMVSFDTYNSKYNSGFGVTAFKDWQGKNYINSTEIGFQYAYELYLNRSISFRPGLQVGLVSRNLNYGGLTLPEDFDNNGQIGAPLSGRDQVQYVDISSGGIAYTENFWIGFSMHHINRPNQSYVKGVSRLPAKVAITGGYKIKFRQNSFHHLEYLDHDREYSITPTFHYKSQGESDQLDFGLYGVYDFAIVGFWYRGIPVKYYERRFQNNESIIVLLGWKFNQITVTYSYDFTMSRLVRAKTGGSHELNLTWVYKKKHHTKIMKRLPCPNFNHH